MKFTDVTSSETREMTAMTLKIQLLQRPLKDQKLLVQPSGDAQRQSEHLQLGLLRWSMLVTHVGDPC